VLIAINGLNATTTGSGGLCHMPAVITAKGSDTPNRGRPLCVEVN
uniref:Succinate--CoA ligase [ADP-forming] subunit beta, mitochondrial n=1 Tax=Parascaris univalens TaxID=6257 RepID=A0A914ZH29_PARUN